VTDLPGSAPSVRYANHAEPALNSSEHRTFVRVVAERARRLRDAIAEPAIGARSTARLKPSLTLRTDRCRPSTPNVGGNFAPDSRSRYGVSRGCPNSASEYPAAARPGSPVPARAPHPSAYGGGDAVDELVVEAAGATMVQRADAIVRWAQPSPLNRHRTSSADRLATALSPSVGEPATHRRWWRTVRSGRRAWPSPSRCHPRRSAARPRDRPTHRRGSAR